jgi:hypothetical protein
LGVTFRFRTVAFVVERNVIFVFEEFIVEILALRALTVLRLVSPKVAAKFLPTPASRVIVRLLKVPLPAGADISPSEDVIFTKVVREAAVIGPNVVNLDVVIEFAVMLLTSAFEAERVPTVFSDAPVMFPFTAVISPLVAVISPLVVV